MFVFVFVFAFAFSFVFEVRVCVRVCVFVFVFVCSISDLIVAMRQLIYFCARFVSADDLCVGNLQFVRSQSEQGADGGTRKVEEGGGAKKVSLVIYFSTFRANSLTKSDSHKTTQRLDLKLAPHTS